MFESIFINPVVKTFLLRYLTIQCSVHLTYAKHLALSTSVYKSFWNQAMKAVCAVFNF